MVAGGFPWGNVGIEAVQKALRQRRQALAEQVSAPVLLGAGAPVPRNFPANVYPFRASSHFLYFAGWPLAQAAILLDQGKLTLFMDNPQPGAALWHGPSPDREAWAEVIGADATYPLADLPQYRGEAVTLPGLHSQWDLAPETGDEAQARSRALAAAIVDLRLCQDDLGLGQMRQAAAISVAAHRAGMAATPGATTEAEVRAAMEQVIIGHQATCAYNSIVTVHGEVLHNEQYHHPCNQGTYCWRMWGQK